MINLVEEVSDGGFLLSISIHIRLLACNPLDYLRLFASSVMTHTVLSGKATRNTNYKLKRSFLFPQSFELDFNMFTSTIRQNFCSFEYL